MADSRQVEKSLDRSARRTVYCMVMGVGAFFAYFNSKYRWITPPEYERVKGKWLEPLLPALEPYLPTITLLLGVVFLAVAAYNFYCYATMGKDGG